MKSTQDVNKEFQALLSFKSVSGLLFYASAGFWLLALIGIFCPFASYNSTVSDRLKCTVSFINLHWVAVLGLLLFVGAVILLLLMVIALTKPDWRLRTKQLLFLAIGQCICAVLAVLFVVFGLVLYEIPESGVAMLGLNWEAGMVLFLLGSVASAAATLGFAASLRALIRKNLPAKALHFGRI